MWVSCDWVAAVSSVLMPLTLSGNKLHTACRSASGFLAFGIWNAPLLAAVAIQGTLQMLPKSHRLTFQRLHYRLAMFMTLSLKKAL